MEIFFQIGVYIPLLPAIIAAMNWSVLSNGQKWFTIMLWSIAILSISGRLWTIFDNDNNLPFFHIYILVEYLFLLVIFKALLGFTLRNSLWITLAVGFTLVWIINAIWGEGIMGYPAYIHSLEAIVLISLTIMWFVKVLHEKIFKRISHTFDFWLCTGVIFYFSGNLLLFFFSSFISQQNSRVFDAIWGIHAILSILLYIIYSVAIIWAVKTPKS